MRGASETLETFLEAHPACALVEVVEAKGSTPREEGAWMLVAPAAIFGTIGGGQLEWMAIDEARRGTQRSALLDIPLGPEIGQCCGGRVKLGIRMVDDTLRQVLVSDAQALDAARPQVLVFGAGHVGHALAAALALLPVRVTVVETRGDALDGLVPGVQALLTPVPEEAVRAAPPGSALLILTHDHALDFLLVAEALRRDDAAYVGMIGSKTKRATFRRWFLSEAGGTEKQFARLVCPIGGISLRDKRPAVIAALAAAEIVSTLFAEGEARSQDRARSRAQAG